MQPPGPMQPSEPSEPTLPPRSTPMPPDGPPGAGAGSVRLPGPAGWGGPQAPYGGLQTPYGRPMAPVARRHGLATAALVLGLVGLVMFWFFGIVPLLALIFGLISTKAINRSGGTLSGLGQARAGVILGLIGVAGAGVFLWAVATDRINTDDDSASFLEADVGDCLGEVPEAAVVFELHFVSCDVAHAAEVYAVGDLNPDHSREYPGDTAILTEVETACFAEFEPYVGITYELSVFEVYYLYPRQLGWKSVGGGGYYCMLVEVGTTNVGSAFHSDR